MDGEPVEEGEPSNRQFPRTFAQAFMLFLPVYMSFGMTPDEYWHGPCYLAQAYREAYEMRRAEKNRDMWRQGAYIYDTLLRVSPMFRASFSKGKIEPEKYISEPYPLTQKEAEERQEQQRKQNIRRMLAMLNKESEENQKKGASRNGGEH